LTRFCGPNESCFDNLGCCAEACDNQCCSPGQTCCNKVSPKQCCKPNETCTRDGCCPTINACDDLCCSLASQGCFKGCCATNTSNLSLTGTYNYVLASGCQNIEGLKVSLYVTQDMVATVGTNQNGGFSMQLNAYNPKGPSTNWMQYLFYVLDNAIWADIQYWDAPNSTITFDSGWQSIVSLNSNTVPAGYVLEIELNYDSISWNVTGATFKVTDNTGHTTSQALAVDASHQFPIVALQTNVVGPGNGSCSAFSSGSGTIFYSVSNGQLCIEGGLPEVCSGSNTNTNEGSNTTYGMIEPPFCCGSGLEQSLAWSGGC